MRNPKRIKRICKLFEKIWEKLPDWRFGQLYVNMFGSGDTFHLPDDVLEHALKDWYKQVNHKPTKQEKIINYQAVVDLWGGDEKVPYCLQKAYKEERELWMKGKKKNESNKTK